MGVLEGNTAVCGQHTEDVLVFTAGGTCAGGLIEVGKVDTPGGHAV